MDVMVVMFSCRVAEMSKLVSRRIFCRRLLYLMSRIYRSEAHRSQHTATFYGLLHLSYA